ncbi:hypothetical protein DUNSADRAFT_3221 [Dunaliella salina]|uniref:Secreted protein n=1 Tax=Dunaliella salina TaxID=3046 RepID=A0ABQ7GUF5_DUNSA|nr:hypothetical protein DUNSADRAFT_3221 [Dunaliella salina]|eukprot:KAF5838241.1 hypothetical protein DUNSADRAFT_3221 [Dunaliella salina]
MMLAALLFSASWQHCQGSQWGVTSSAQGGASFRQGECIAGVVMPRIYVLMTLSRRNNVHVKQQDLCGVLASLLEFTKAKMKGLYANSLP